MRGIMYVILACSLAAFAYGVVTYSSISVVLGLGLLWYYCRKGGKG